MGRAHRGGTGDPQHEPGGAAEPRDISERVAAVVLAFHALREGRPPAGSAATIAPPPDASDVAGAPAGAPPGPPLPRRVPGAATRGRLAPAGNGAASWPIDRPGAAVPVADATAAAREPTLRANGKAVVLDAVSAEWPAPERRVERSAERPVERPGERPGERPVERPGERLGESSAESSTAVRPLDAALLHLAALAVAVWALVAPWPAVVAVAAGSTAVVAAGLARDRPQPGAFARRAGRRVASWLRPRSLVWLPVLTARVVILAVALPFAVGAGRWLAEHGSDGDVAAGRAAAWHHGFRVAAAGVCFLLVTGSGAAHDRRARALRRRLQPLGTTGIVSLAVAAVTLVLCVPVLGPRFDGGPLTGADGLAWVPPTLRDNVDRVRDAMVRAELHAATVCLSERQDSPWEFTYTDGNPPAAPDVATLRTEQADPSAGDVATVVVAVHNQLAPWVEGIEVVADGTPVARVERQSLPTAGPVAHSPVGAATVGADLLRDGVDGFDRGVALQCSAGAVL